MFTEIIKPDTHIDFISRWKYCAALSVAVIVAGLVAIPILGFRLGVDFKGGTELQVRFTGDAAVGEAEVRRVAAAVIQEDDLSVVRFGDESVPEFLIKFPGDRAISEAAQADILPKPEAATFEPLEGAEEAPAEASEEAPAEGAEDALAESAEEAAAEEAEPEAAPTETAESDAEERAPPEADGGTSDGFNARNDLIEALVVALETEIGPLEPQRVEFVGPKVGAELRNDGLRAIGVACLVILAYIAFRFSARFAPGAVVALLHDVLVTSSVWILLGLEFDLKVLAALLAIIGYSLNDTIIVYDRIRENLELHTRHDLIYVLNRSVNQTLSRTLLTSATTLAAVLALLFLGGTVIRPFAMAMTIGVLVGTYSSIYVAAPTLLFLESRFGGGSAAKQSTAKERADQARGKARTRGKGRQRAGA
ncbi:MAG: protein translocase subunit SecF [Myxococcota bacterium]|nr:protein translocase subunit SecF [Myxococcota bacterium]